ncbi:hypothetical protein BUALT_Bualt05G0110800 [Buddleja alternifolia]|uniref:Sesquiterpene synthase n=1 Tax=Buddleja alternifolia TaxID=168488 RepID=A0AAV6XMP3_9LAMI|nr:hypothetical protein BUALT_Bualt05G0110800 [Buddleja alternifolia]
MENHPPPAAPISIENANFEDVRRSVTYHPSIWGDYFLTHTSNIMELSANEAEEFQKLREEVRDLLIKTPDDSLHKVELIDEIQRLGVAYHFENEIDISLKSIYDTYSECNGKEDNDLHMVALRFRLIRQQGHNLSSGKWELSALETLPPYMKLCYQALLDVYDETEDEMNNLETSYRLYYAKEEMKKLVRAYFEEAKWVYNNYIPTMEEYMSVALVSGAYMMLSTTSLVGMGSLVTRETFEWVTNEPLIVRASSVICRLMDDMVGHGFEKKSTAMDCYMKQNGATKEKAFGEFHKQVNKAWKDINEEFLHPEAMPIPVLMRVLNLARVINLLYTDEDGYGNCKTKLKEFIETVLVDPIII